jgi:hypothetical protein
MTVPIRILPLLLAALSLAACATKGARAYNEAQRALAKKKYKQAIAGFQKAVKENPDFGEAHYNLGAARYHLAVKTLGSLVKARGSAALKAHLKQTDSQSLRKRVNVPADQARLDPQELKKLTAALAALPAKETAPILALLKQSFADKAKARTLFRAGKWVVVKKPQARKRMLEQLAALEQMRGFLYETSQGDRGLLLLAVARPTLVPVPKTTAKKGATK